MGKRRGDGEGSIYQAKDGRWRAEISLGYKPDGKPKRKVIYGKTRLDVSTALNKALSAHGAGQNIKPERQSLADFMTEWLENTVKLKNKPQTWRSYEWLVRVHINPSIGKHPLQKVSRPILQTMIREKQAQGLSPTTIRHINATLKSALSRAVKDGTLLSNPAKLTDLPRVKRFQAQVLTPEQAKVLIIYLAGHQHEALYVMALSMGLRRGELLGLRWSDVDLEHAVLDVRHSLHRVKGDGLHLGEPKSERAKRKLRIPQVCLTALVRWRLLQAQHKQWAGLKWTEEDFVFTGAAGKPLHPDEISRELPAILTAAGLPKMRLHDLRHGCASLLLAQGVHARAIMEQMGHSSFQITMDLYSHVLPALRNEVADRMDEVFSSTPTSAPTGSNRLVVQ